MCRSQAEGLECRVKWLEFCPVGTGEPWKVRSLGGAMPDGHHGKDLLVVGGDWTEGSREVRSLS